MKATTSSTRRARALVAGAACTCVFLVAGCGGLREAPGDTVTSTSPSASASTHAAFALPAPTAPVAAWPGGLTPDVVIDTGSAEPRAIHAVDANTLWAVVGENAVSIDARTGRQLSAFPVEPGSDSITVLDDSVWVKGESSGIVAQYRLPEGTPGARVNASMPSGMVAAHGSVWVSEHREGTVLRIDPTSGSATSITVADAGRSGPQSLVADDRAVYVSVSRTRAVHRIDAKTEVVVRLQGERFACGPMVKVDQVVWGTGCVSGTWVAGFDTSTSGPAGRIDLTDRYAEDMELVGDKLVASTAVSVFTDGVDVLQSPGIAVLDPRSKKLVRTLELTDGGGPSAVAGGRLWVLGLMGGSLLGFDLADLTALVQSRS